MFERILETELEESTGLTVVRFTPQPEDLLREVSVRIPSRVTNNGLLVAEIAVEGALRQECQWVHRSLGRNMVTLEGIPIEGSNEYDINGAYLSYDHSCSALEANSQFNSRSQAHQKYWPD